MANVISKYCNNRVVSIIAICVFLILIAGTGYLYFQKYLGDKKAAEAKAAQEDRQAAEDERLAKISKYSATPETVEPRTDYEKEMMTAAKKYWLDTYGEDNTEIPLKNYGCHVAVEAVKDGATVATLNYDGSKITEIEK